MPIKDVLINGKNKLPIQVFKLESMVRHPSIVMIAKRGSGKSVVCKAIMKHFRDIPVGTIISPTDKMSNFYGKFFPKSFIHYEYKTAILKNLFQRQEIMIDKRRQKIKRGKKVDPRAFIIMDDCLASKGTWMKDDKIKEIFMNGRHFKIMYILTMQFPLGISPELRANFDYIFLLADDQQSNIKRMYDHYAGMFPTLDAFKQVFHQLTSNYGAMVIVNRGARAGILEKIYSYKAPIDSEIKSIGCKQFLKFHEHNYDYNWKDKTKQLDVMGYFQDQKKEKTAVKIDIVDENKKKYFNKFNK